MASSVELIDFHGLPAYRLTAASGATATVTLFGAQVVSWTVPTEKGPQEQLFLSERANYDGSVSIRGGIPVCFPQFSALGDLPKHGFVRTRDWFLDTKSTPETSALLCLVTSDEDDNGSSRKLWPHAFRAELTVVIDAERLDVELAVENSGDTPFTFTAALHSYLRVKEVEHSHLQGLAGFEYRDAAHGNLTRQEQDNELTVDDEVDRVYHDVNKPLLLTDSVRHIAINSRGFADTVVWNPWEHLCAKLPDMAPLDFRHMLCVEAAAARKPVTVAPGDIWLGRQTLAVVG